jgi:hypothetical protein
VSASFLSRLARAGYGGGHSDAPDAPGGAATPSPRTVLLAELRGRIERIEARAPVATPRLPPMPLVSGSRAAPLALERLAGAVREPDGVVVVRHRVAPSERVGRVAPADAMVAHPDVAAPLAGLPTPAPSELLHGLRVLDIETTGLAGGTGTLAFLVGVAQFEPDGTLLVEQLVLGAPVEEERLLTRLAETLRGATLLVTFNGRSFDAPLLRTRCVLRRKAPGPLATAPHLDLLGVSRRLWRGRGVDCRLQTLERAVLGSRRLDDFPGALAPAAYSEFLRSGDAAVLAPIVEHNRLDLVGTAALLAAALRTLEQPLLWAEDPSELLAVGEHRLGLDDIEGALPLLERALEFSGPDGGETRRRALTQLARVHRRAGRIDLARALWDRYRREFPRENLGYEELAKLLEHRARDPHAALAVAASAPHVAADSLSKRIARLERKTRNGRLAQVDFGA